MLERESSGSDSGKAAATEKSDEGACGILAFTFLRSK